jgi:hypothetical protein
MSKLLLISDRFVVFVLTMLLTLSLIILLCEIDLTYYALALSPSFGKKEIVDPGFDWVNMRTGQHIQSEKDVPYFTDISSVDYYSDGKTLNATLWTFFPFQNLLKYNTVDYGMLIDSDFDNKTGFGGIDYKLEISWDNHTKTWTKKLVQWSVNGEQRNLTITKNFKGFGENGKNYVLLSLDLGSILYPDKYKVTFYADVQKDSDSDIISDFTRWIAVPPPNLHISTLPISLSLTQGDSETIEVKVNSPEGYTPTVNLSAQSQTGDGIKFFFKKGFNKLVVPSYGTATTDMVISAADNASISSHTLTIFANSSFPPENIVSANGFSNKELVSLSPIPKSVEESQNIVSQSIMAINILPALTWQQQISEAWNGFGSAINGFIGLVTALIGVLGIFGGWFLRKSKVDKDTSKKE